MKYSAAVLIGRFQPFHEGHAKLLRQALNHAPTVVLVLGSANSARSIRNPFRPAERQAMIEANLSGGERARLRFVRVRDYFYNNAAWTNEVLQKVARVSPGSIALLGFAKDHSSQYLRWFPNYDFVASADSCSLSATPIRENFLRDPSNLSQSNGISAATRAWLADFAATNPAYGDLHEEQRMIDQYRSDWAASPYPPVFVTTDSIVVQAGHVLLIQRKSAPGKGQWALPGGFLNPDEFLRDCALRELSEETKIELSASQLTSALVSTRAFDHPLRSSRGRTITHAHFFKLPGDHLAKVRANDDAAQVQWVPLLDLAKLEENFYEDHFQILESMLLHLSSAEAS